MASNRNAAEEYNISRNTMKKKEESRPEPRQLFCETHQQCISAIPPTTSSSPRSFVEHNNHNIVFEIKLMPSD